MANAGLTWPEAMAELARTVRHLAQAADPDMSITTRREALARALEVLGRLERGLPD